MNFSISEKFIYTVKGVSVYIDQLLNNYHVSAKIPKSGSKSIHESKFDGKFSQDFIVTCNLSYINAVILSKVYIFDLRDVHFKHLLLLLWNIYKKCSNMFKCNL